MHKGSSEPALVVACVVFGVLAPIDRFLMLDQKEMINTTDRAGSLGGDR